MGVSGLVLLTKDLFDFFSHSGICYMFTRIRRQKGMVWNGLIRTDVMGFDLDKLLMVW